MSEFISIRGADGKIELISKEEYMLFLEAISDKEFFSKIHDDLKKLQDEITELVPKQR